MYLSVFVIILTLFSVVGMKTVRTDKHKEWIEDTMLASDYSPPQFRIMKGNKNVIKRVGYVYYVYIKHGNDEEMKKALVYMLAYTISGFKRDSVYYSAIDKMMITGDVDRSVKCA